MNPLFNEVKHVWLSSCCMNWIHFYWVEYLTRSTIKKITKATARMTGKIWFLRKLLGVFCSSGFVSFLVVLGVNPCSFLLLASPINFAIDQPLTIMANGSWFQLNIRVSLILWQCWKMSRIFVLIQYLNAFSFICNTSQYGNRNLGSNDYCGLKFCCDVRSCLSRWWLSRFDKYNIRKWCTCSEKEQEQQMMMSS